ncbi:MAG: glycosyltransferase involved in cell wall biosynthesis [Verrucomicrobiales bacterium]|jgi:glycosyltransferase involved in cell wall biosynthesis
MIQGIQARGAKVLLALNQENQTWVDAEVEGLPLIPLALGGRYDFKAIKAIRRLIIEEHIDIVHCTRNNRPIANTIIAIRGLPVKLVAYRGTSGNLSRWDPASRMTYLHPRIDRLVGVSQAVCDYLASMKVPAHKLAQIYKGHDLAWYETEAADLSAEGIPEGAFVIGCASALRELKGIDTFIEALKLLPPDQPVHALLAGVIKDDYLVEMAKTVPAPHAVHFTGFRKDAPALMGACDVFLLASKRREGLPRALIEAMSQGVAPVVTAVGGMKELVVDRACGLVVPPEDPAALAEAIQTMMADPEQRRAWGAAARERIRSDFSVGMTVEKTWAMYEALLAE